MNIRLAFLIGLVALLAFEVNQRGTPPIFDEDLLYNRQMRFDTVEWSRVLTADLTDQTVGPLWQLTHRLAKPLTQYNAFRMRLLNIALALIALYVFHATFRRLGEAKPLDAALALYALPTLWIVTGMAITEVPAILFVALSLYALVTSLQQNSLGWAALGGLCASIAALGRTPYVALAPAAVLTALLLRQHVRQLVLYGFIAASLPLFFFLQWRGLLPPIAQEKDFGIAYDHAVFSFGYAAILVAFLAPGWFTRKRLTRRAVAVLTLCFLVLNVLVLNWQIVPLAGSIGEPLQRVSGGVYGGLIPALLFGAGLWLLASLFSHRREWLRDELALFTVAGALLLLLAAGAVRSQFSSRYPTAAAPLLLVLLRSHAPTGYWRWLRILVAAAIALLALSAYFGVL